MPERNYLAIVNIHGNIRTVRAPCLDDLRKKVEDVLVVPKASYPNFDFESQIEVLRVKPLLKKHRRAFSK